MMRENARNNSMEEFSLKEIADWGLKDSWAEGAFYAALPPIQRGFVWKPEQIECLWDSIIQGFPIGALLLEVGEFESWRSYAGVNKRDTPPKWQLLDGQQRATSIIKGFHDIWSSPKSGQNPVSALWVDLSPEKMEQTDRRFLFRLVTKSHPWGYKKSDPSKPLSASSSYKALEAFRILDSEKGKNDGKKNGKQKNPHEFDLHQVFPWDANAPVPLALLLQVINNDGKKDVAKKLQSKLDKTDFWQNASEKNIAHFTNVKEILANPTDKFKTLVSDLHHALRTLQIPAPVLNINPDDHETSDENNSTFNLFKRVNSGGTTLSNEEIQYSLLKSVWSDAPEIIEGQVLKDCQLCQPTRMVSLMARLFLMINEKMPDGKDSKVAGLQPLLNIGQFQSLLHEFKDKFEAFCKEDGKELVKQVWGFLVYDSPQRSFGLPRVLAADIARSHPDLLLLLMYWVYRNRIENISSLSVDQHQRSLGFVTAVAWFAEDEGRCIQRLAKQIREIAECDITDFFNEHRFTSLLKKDDRDRTLMVNLRSPEEVKTAFRSKLTNQILAEDPQKNETWKKEGFWNLYPPFDDTSGKGNWYPANDAERSFLHKVFKDPKWHKLLYAQRKYIEEWYDWFDPTQPKAITDRNRPWDYDHILPQSWSHDGRGVFSEFPHLVRTWIWSIGNFRAWPMEHNRSKGNTEMFEAKLEDYELMDLNSVQKASFIKIPKNWLTIDETLKEKELKFWECENAWPSFIEAALERTVEVYSEWYKNLKISSLMEGD